MDVLADVLRTARASGALSARTDLRAPWGLHFDEALRAGFHVVAQGTCWLRVGDAPPAQLVQGDVVYLPHGTPHVLADAPGRSTRDWRDLYADQPGPDLVAGGDGARTVLLCGSYRLDAGGPSPLLGALPDLIHVPAEQAAAGGALAASLTLLSAETGARQPGSAVVVDRLVDVLLVYLLRAWLARQPPGHGGWLAALADPQVGRALELLHAEPGRRWTVASLARAVGLSRAAFARRFAELVGEPPLAYLTGWRMTVAARLLRDGNDPLTVVADRVGYDSEFAFAKAFKRARGLPPGRYRAAVRAA
jgi:AraC-like DNA-binding protein